MKESQVQKKIKERLERNGFFVTKLIQTSTNGIPDIMAIKRGNVVFLEVKAEGGKLSELQEFRIEQLKSVGVFARVVYGLEDIDVLCPKK
jgi:Holliday junction resolvase